MIKAILFDLDGTLSLMNKDEFMRNYYGLLVPRFAHLISPERFLKQLQKSTEAMIKEPNPGRTNLQTFFEDFKKALNFPFNTLWPIFEEYYKSDFPALKCLVKSSPDGKKTVEAAQNQGYLIAIASNPVMPKIAIEERIRWAELSPDQFSIVPSLEEFHFCKPHPGFFEETAQKLGVSPDNCLMVGNDPVEDLAARKVGMKTFLVGEPPENVDTDYSGCLNDLIQLILRGNL